jgi:hypothetical protein
MYIIPMIKTDIKIELGSLTVSVSWQKWHQGHSSPAVGACNTQYACRTNYFSIIRVLVQHNRDLHSSPAWQLYGCQQP